MRQKILVIGSGIIGLGTALRLLELGHEVVICSAPQHFMPTSPVAAAFWFPYACSLTQEQEIALAKPTFEFLLECEKDPQSGVFQRRGRSYFDETVNLSDTPVPWWSSLTNQFSELNESDIPISLRSDRTIGPIERGWEFAVPIVHIPTFLDWLQSKVKAIGGKFMVAQVASFQSVDDSFQHIFNCAGGWATHLTPDSKLVGYQGTVVELEGEPFGQDLVFLEKGKSSDLPTYIVPQRCRTILGGTYLRATQPGTPWIPAQTGQDLQWLGRQSDVSGILDRCRLLASSYAGFDATKLAATKHKTGLRPVRIDSPPRIDREVVDGRSVIHNYGHGGSGVTLFWGSALAAAKLLDARDSLRDDPQSK